MTDSGSTGWGGGYLVGALDVFEHAPQVVGRQKPVDDHEEADDQPDQDELVPWQSTASDGSGCPAHMKLLNLGIGHEDHEDCLLMDRSWPLTPEGADDVQVEGGTSVLPHGELVQLTLGVGLVERARVVVCPGASDVAVGAGVLLGEPSLQLMC